MVDNMKVTQMFSYSTGLAVFCLSLLILFSPLSLNAQQRQQVPDAQVTRFSASNGKEFACYDSQAVKVLKRPAQVAGNVRIRLIKKKWFLKKLRIKRKDAKDSGDQRKLRKVRQRFKNKKALYEELVATCAADEEEEEEETPEIDNLEPLTRALAGPDVRRLADVAGYGISPADSSLFDAMPQGIEAVVNTFTTVKSEPSGFETTRSNWLGGNPDEENSTTKDGLNLSAMYAAINTNNPFHYKLFEFLLGLITIADDTFDQSAFDMAMMKSYHNLLLSAAKSNDLDYIDLYRKMNKHPAMLRYLDGDLNRGCDSPNENLAREDMELFGTGTVKLCGSGAGTPVYSEADVEAAAKALTGWRIAPGVPDEGAESPANHCPGPHVMFTGTSDQVSIEDLDDFIDDVVFGVKKVDTSLFLAQQLALFYLSDDPGCDLLSSIASEIRANNFKLLPVIKKLLRSEAFYDGPKHRIAKGVFDYIATTVRNSGIPYPISTAENYVKNSDSRIHKAPTVFYYFPSDHVNDARQVAKVNFAQNLCRDAYDGWSPEDSMIPSGTPGAVDVINHIADLFHVTLSLDQRLQLIEALNTDDNGNEDLFDVANLNHITRVMTQVCAPIAASPQAQLR